MSRALLAPLAVVPAARPVAGRYVDGFACRLCGAFAPRHLPLTHAADCRERNALVIAIYQRTASGVVRADTATTVAEARAKLRGIDAPAIAFDGLLAVGATWRTTERERVAITKHVDNVGRGRSTAGDSCRLCTDPCARVTFKTPAALAGFCSTHRDRIRSCRGLDATDPAAVDAYVARRRLRDGR